MSDKEIDHDALLDILKAEESRASDWHTDVGASYRQDAFRYFMGEARGDEQEGQSSVVSTDVSEVIESAVPALVRVFTAADDLVTFTPNSPEGEAMADEASDYCQHVLMRENPGFRILDWAVKDACLYRVGAVKVWVAEEEESREESYAGLTPDMLATLRTQVGAQTDAEVEIYEEPGEAIADPETGEAVPTVNVRVEIETKKKRVVVDNIAPEELLVSPAARSLNEAAFVGHRTKTTAGALRARGVPEDVIEQLKGERPNSAEVVQREATAFIGRDVGRENPAEREIWIVEGYVKADMDGDGKAERIRVVYAHGGGGRGYVIEADEWDEPPAVALFHIALLPHTLEGRSLYDFAKETQDVSTALTRGMLDGLYLSNRPRPAVSTSVEIGDLLDFVPGAPIRFRDGAKPGDGHLQWTQAPDTSQSALAGLAFQKDRLESRTGISRASQGVDPALLQGGTTATAVNQVMSAALQRQSHYAATLANGGMKTLYDLIYRAIKRASLGATTYRVGKGDWRECDPSQWPDAMGLDISVGAGSGSRVQEAASLGAMVGLQEKIVTAQGGVAGPFVNAAHIGRLLTKVSANAGFKSGQLFASPEEAEKAASAQAGQPPKPDPAMQLAQAKIQADQLTAQANAAIKQQSAQSDAELARAKAEADMMAKREQMQAELALARERAALELDIERERGRLQIQLMREKAAAEIELKRQELGFEAALRAQENANAAAAGVAATSPGNIAEVTQ